MAPRLMRRAAAPLLAAALVAGGTVTGADLLTGDDGTSAPTVSQPAPSPAPPRTEAAEPVAPTVEPGDAVTSAPAATRTISPLRKARRIILRQTNRHRAAADQPRLRPNRRMNRVAQRWTRTMAAATSMSHNPAVGTQIRPGWSTWAENVAYGYGPRRVVRAWMNSPGHRENILRDVTHLGVGMARGPDGKLYYTQVFARY